MVAVPSDEVVSWVEEEPKGRLMQSDIDVLVHALHQEKEAAKKALEDARQSKFACVAWTLLFCLGVGIWFAGEQASKYYAQGFEAGAMSTEEGRLTRQRESAAAQARTVCDERGGRCINR